MFLVWSCHFACVIGQWSDLQSEHSSNLTCPTFVCACRPLHCFKMARTGSGEEWSEASAGRIANFRQVYREKVENIIEDEKAELEEAGDTTGASLPPRPFRSIPPWRQRDTAKAEKWKHSAGLRFPQMPRTPEEENLSMRHSQVLAASFVPQRHLRFVLGRPVLVPLMHVNSSC